MGNFAFFRLLIFFLFKITFYILKSLTKIWVSNSLDPDKDLRFVVHLLAGNDLRSVEYCLIIFNAEVMKN